MNVMKRFERLAGQGIQTKEVEAAKVCLTRELGRPPTLPEVAEFLELYIAWRREVRQWKNGEIVKKIEYTRKGSKVKSLALAVNNIIANHIRKGGE